ncbi:universal stress protein [Nocardia niigatensis]
MDTNACAPDTAVCPDQRRQPVIVGIDGSRAAVRAAEWAAEEAAARRSPLRLVAVVPAIDKPAFRPGGSRYREAAHALEAARDAVLARHPSTGEDPLDIAVEVRRGQADHVLRDASGAAALLVLGSTGIGFFSHMVLGSTALTVARESRCPVALVRPADARRSGVLVVVTDWHSAKPALRAAFQAAQDRGTDVTVARVWQGRPWSGIPEWGTGESLISDAQIRRCAQDYPGVEFRPVTIVGDVVTAVERFSGSAQLVVVTHRSDAITPSRLGHPVQDLVRHSTCPVLILPDTPDPAIHTEVANR